MTVGFHNAFKFFCYEIVDMVKKDYNNDEPEVKKILIFNTNYMKLNRCLYYIIVLSVSSVSAFILESAPNVARISKISKTLADVLMYIYIIIWVSRYGEKIYLWNI